MKNISMERCSKWDSCSAPVCPMGDWVHARHYPEEPVCEYLRQAAKGTKGVMPSGMHSKEIFSQAEAVWEQKPLLDTTLQSILNRSSQKGSKLANPNLIAKAA